MPTDAYTLDDIIEILKEYGEKDYFFYRSFNRAPRADEFKYKIEYLKLLNLVFDRFKLDGESIDVTKYESMVIWDIKRNTWRTTDGDYIPCIYGKAYCLYECIASIFKQELNKRTGINDSPMTQEELDSVKAGQGLYKHVVASKIVMTAEQARFLMLDEKRLKEIEKLIKISAKMGKHSCMSCFLSKQESMEIGLLLADRGYIISHSGSWLIVKW